METSKSKYLNILLFTGGILGGLCLHKKIEDMKVMKKRLTLIDVLPYIRLSTEVRRIYEREPLFNVFIKKENFVDFVTKNEDRIIKQSILPTDLYLVKGDSYTGNLKELLNTEICAIGKQKDNEQMIEILLV